MDKKKYSAKLRDPRWQKLRLEVFERDEWACQKCFDTNSTLAVHHFRYISGREPWEYPLHLLTTLCENCHSEEYEMFPQELSSLIEQIKEKGFFSDQINDIATGFNALRSNGPPYNSSVIQYFLSTPAVFDMVEELYWKDLEAKNEAKKNGAT